MREIDEDAWHAYERELRARNLSPETAENYRRTLEKLSAALPAAGLLGATPRQVQAWLAAVQASPEYSATTLATYFRRARTFYAWACRMDYLDGPSPMAKLKAPREPVPEIPLHDAADVLAMIAACAGKDFRARRDLAMIRLMLETGTPRALAIATLRRDQLDLRRDLVTVTDKGAKDRTIPFGPKAAHALTLYLRMRAAHPKADKLPQLFLGKRGAMTRDGVYRCLEYRCNLAGIPVISPHDLRHFTAHAWFQAGGSEGDAMALFGWSNPAMPHRYARAAAASRAQAHARDAALADRL